MRRSTGKEPFRRRITGITPFFEHLLRNDGDTMYCAWKGDNLVGFGSALVRGKQWYLAFLFVHPKYQSEGIGRKLIEKVWRDGPGMTHALATFSYNMHAVGLYSSFGMVPLCTILMMYIKPENLPDRKELRRYLGNDLKIIESPGKADLQWIHNLERKIRGYPHKEEWDLWLENDSTKVFIFREGRKRVGYSMNSSQSGFVAPAGAISSDYLTRITIETLYRTKPPKKAPIKLFCPTHNTQLYRAMLDIGMRNEEMLLLLSDKVYWDFDRYLPASLAVF